MQSLWPQTVLLVANKNCCLITYLLLRCNFNNAFSRMMQFSGSSVRNPTNDSHLPLKCICREPRYGAAERIPEISSEKDLRDLCSQHQTLKKRRQMPPGEDRTQGPPAFLFLRVGLKISFSMKQSNPCCCKTWFCVFFFLKQVSKLTGTSVESGDYIHGCKFNLTRYFLSRKQFIFRQPWNPSIERALAAIQPKHRVSQSSWAEVPESDISHVPLNIISLVIILAGKVGRFWSLGLVVCGEQKLF